jgi:nitroreductase
MDVLSAIETRRSIKKFTDRPVTREEMETLFAAAARAPNHRLTEPWRFYVLGPGARRAYGRVLAARKARRVEDPAVAAQVAAKVEEEHAALPGMIAMAVREDENPEIREEDYGAMMMGVQNLALAAVTLGLGTHIKTGAVMQDPGARSAVGVADDERIVAIVNVGEPAEVPAPKARRPATDFITWVD